LRAAAFRDFDFERCFFAMRVLLFAVGRGRDRLFALRRFFRRNARRSDLLLFERPFRAFLRVRRGGLNTNTTDSLTQRPGGTSRAHARVTA